MKTAIMASRIADNIAIRPLLNIASRFHHSKRPLGRLGPIACLGMMTVVFALLVGIGANSRARAPKIGLDDSALECGMARHMSEAIAVHKSLRPSIADPFGVGMTMRDSASCQRERQF